MRKAHIRFLSVKQAVLTGNGEPIERTHKERISRILDKQMSTDCCKTQIPKTESHELYRFTHQF